MNLVLFMTRGMSLTAWQENGSLERELALYAELAKHGCNTAIISWGDQRDKAIAARYPWLTVYVNRWHLSQQRYENLMPVLHAKAFVLADIIKSNQINGADCALRCARLWRKPFVARCGYLWSQNSRDAGKEDLQQALNLEQSIFSQCDCGIVTTESMRAYIKDTHGVVGDNFFVIPNYITSNWFEEPLPPHGTLTKVIVTHLGRLSSEKNCYALIDACASLPVTLRFIGDGPLKEDLRQYALERGVETNFTGTVPSAGLPPLLGGSAVVALVSFYEGHPKALIEAMARGCAVLGTRVRGIEPCIEDGVTGVLCETDASSIRDGLERLLNDVDLRRKLGEAARQSAHRFHVSAVAQKELKLYDDFPRRSLMRKGMAVVRLAIRAVPWGVKKLRVKFGGMLNGSIMRRVWRHRQASACDAPRFLKLRVKFNDTVNGNITKYIMRLVDWRLRLASAGDALRFLFDLESRLYPLEGQYAVAYDGGIHTKHRHTQYHDFFVERLQPGERVLDIGCGNGFLAYDMAAKGGGHVTGIELNAENVATARQKFSHPNIKFIHGDALKDLPSGAYNTVVLSNVLEHLPGRIDFLRRIRERLHPARFLLRVPLFERDWRVPLKKELGVEWRLDATHETEYTQEQFACELACADLYITDFQIRWGEIWCEARSDVPYARKRHANPRVTVLMSVYNGEQYLETAVNSILRQTMRDFDFLIVDDASTDATPQMLADFAAKDARIQILTNEKNLGLPASLNRGIAQIETPYIARMDADDISATERLERQVAYMEQHQEIVATGSRILFFNAEEGECISNIWRLPVSSTLIREQSFLVGPQLSHPSSFIRTTILKSVGCYREQFDSAQDYDLWLRLLDQFELGNVLETLLFFRHQKKSISHMQAQEQAINHTLAMISSEFRREGLADPLQNKKLGEELLFGLLDCSRPSFWRWIYLLTYRAIPKKASLLLQTIDLILKQENIIDTCCMQCTDWHVVYKLLSEAHELSSRPHYAEICKFVQVLSKKKANKV